MPRETRRRRSAPVPTSPRGYSVVALEQATGSSDLAARDLSLPTPAVLLLGAEGEGVPNALFDLVDCCVEIPQLGVVRSLNVHVSGAIAVWMFARQVLLRAAGGGDAEGAELRAKFERRVTELQIAQKEQLDDLVLKMAELKSSLPEKYRKHLEEDSRQTPPPPPRKSSKTSSEGH